jgi:hypothetical protein
MMEYTPVRGARSRPAHHVRYVVSGKEVASLSAGHRPHTDQ